MTARRQPVALFALRTRNAAALFLLLAAGLVIWIGLGSSAGLAGPPNSPAGPVFDYRLDGSAVVLELKTYDGRTRQLPETLRFEIRAAAVATLADCLSGRGFDGGHAAYVFRRAVQSAPADLLSFTPGPEPASRLPCFEITFIREDGRIGKDFQIGPRLPGTAAGQPRADEPQSPSPKAVPPEEFTLEGALEIFRSQLTAEALEDLEGVVLKTHERGCAGPGREHSPVGGCWHRRENTIYIHDSYFPAHYAELEDPIKLALAKSALQVLTHESFHALDNRGDAAGYDSLTSAIFDCYLENPEFTIDEASGQRQRIKPTFWGRTNPAAEACLHAHPFWGEITASLKQLYLERPAAAGLDLSAWDSRAEVFSNLWYVEYYAELPTYDIELPPVLENHYGRYLKDRRAFAKILNDPTHPLDAP